MICGSTHCLIVLGMICLENVTNSNKCMPKKKSLLKSQSVIKHHITSQEIFFLRYLQGDPNQNPLFQIADKPKMFLKGLTGFRL